MLTHWLHYGGDAIELPEGTDVEGLLGRIDGMTAGGWLAVDDAERNQHRIRIDRGVGVRISTTYVAEPAKPVAIPPTTRNIRDVGF